MKNLLFVFFGGGLGSLSRYFIGRIFNQVQMLFPYSTLITNVSSCLILGIAVGWMTGKNIFSPQLQLFLITGFCGGFSTFSAFSLETLGLFENGQIGFAILNILLNMLLCIGAIIVGIYLIRTTIN